MLCLYHSSLHQMAFLQEYILLQFGISSFPFTNAILNDFFAPKYCFFVFATMIYVLKDIPKLAYSHSINVCVNHSGLTYNVHVWLI